MRAPFVVLGLTLLVAAPATAAQLNVNTTADTFDGVCDVADCSLKDAVFEAESTSQSDVIHLQAYATYLIGTSFVTYLTGTDALPKITTPMRIVGHGATIQRAATAPDMRFFELDTTGDLTLEGLTLRDGQFTLGYPGAAIRSLGHLVLDNCLVINNAGLQSGCEGGAIYSKGGSVQLSRSSFIGNRATRGGAVTTDGFPSDPRTVSIDHCSFRGNKAMFIGNASGAALFMRGDTNATIRDSTFVGNMSDALGGAISFHTIPNTYVVDLINLTIAGNTSLSDGGGLYAHTCSDQNCPIVTKPRLTNVILANNLGTPDPSCAGGFASVGHNIIGGSNGSCLITGPTNPPDYPVSTLSGLSGIRDNGDGGGIFRPPLATSLPVNNGDSSFCAPGDQLFLDRQGASCEVGAIEYRPCTPPPSKLVDWWPFDEFSGKIAYDIAAPPNNGTYENTPASTLNGIVGRAHCFDGVNQRVRVPDHNDVDFIGDCALSNAESFTIDTWVKTAAGGVQPIVDKRESTPNFLRGYFLYIQDGQLGLDLANGPGNSICGSVGSACEDYLAAPTILGGVDLADDRWHHVAVVVSRCTNPYGEMYIDGVLANAFTPLTGELTNASDLLIGDAYPVNVGRPPFHGCLDELEIFKRALGAGEIATLYEAGWAGKCKPFSTAVIGNASACVTGMHKGLGLVGKAQGKAVRGCVKDGAAGNLGGSTAEACLAADTKGAVAKASAKTALAELGKCAGVVADFGPADAASVNAAAIEEELGLAADVFGGDLDAALASRSGAPAAARCQDAVVKGYQQVVETKLKVFLACAKSRLKAGTADAAALASCVGDVTAPDSIAASATQPGGKVATAAAKLAGAVAKQCGTVDVATYFPGACASASPASLGQCIEERVECRVCRMLSHASRLDVDCDAFDDGVANASCGW